MQTNGAGRCWGIWGNRGAGHFFGNYICISRFGCAREMGRAINTQWIVWTKPDCEKEPGSDGVYCVGNLARLPWLRLM